MGCGRIMNKIGKISIGILAAVTVFGGAYFGVNVLTKKPSVNMSESSEHISSSSSAQKSSHVSKQKGSVTVANLVNDPSMSAAVLAQYAVDNLNDGSWGAVKTGVKNNEPIKLIVVLDDAGTSYHYGDEKNTPYYRLQGAEGGRVAYYAANDTELTTVALKLVVDDVNAKHGNDDLNKIKMNTTIETAKTDSDDLFSQIAASYLFSSGAGGWHSSMTVSADGSFTGGGKDANYDSDSFWEFDGKFGNVTKVSENEYTMQVTQFRYDPEEKKIIDYNGVKRKTEIIKPWGIADNENVRVYLPGYPTENLSKMVFGWLSSYGSGGVNQKTVVKPVIVVDNEGYKDMGGAPWVQTK